MRFTLGHLDALKTNLTPYSRFVKKLCAEAITRNDLGTSTPQFGFLGLRTRDDALR
jgi:hypothetical protein